MKRTSLILLAGIVVLFSNGWAIFNGRQNRSASTGGALELTERELRLPPVIGDSTALLLDLRWRVDRPVPGRFRMPTWIDAVKLTELGFDCGIPVNDPHAREHYSAMNSAPIYVVLRLEPDSGAAGATAHPRDDRDANSRFVAFDAGLDPRRLRQQHSEAGHIIARAVLRVSLQEHDEQGQALPTPRLGGVIERLVPEEVFVPSPGSRLLQRLRRAFDERNEGPSSAPPRFAATVRWGRHFEPWLSDARLLTNSIVETRNDEP